MAKVEIRKPFLGLDAKDQDAQRANVVVLPIPFERSTSYGKGTSEGPNAIVRASTQVELFDPEMAYEPCHVGICTDWSLQDAHLNDMEIKDALKAITHKTAEYVDRGKFVLGLGGEHTITVGLIDPYIQKYGRDLTVVQIDAHADLKDKYEGNPYSHACVMRRILGRVPIVSVGIRSVDDEEYRVGKESNEIDIFYAHQIQTNPAWISDVLAKVKTKHVYLTVDVDGLDPSVIPCTGTPEPGGLTWYQTMGLIKGLANGFEMVGADVNELSPGPIHAADFAAAKLCYKILAYRFA